MYVFPMSVEMFMYWHFLCKILLRPLQKLTLDVHPSYPDLEGQRDIQAVELLGLNFNQSLPFFPTSRWLTEQTLMKYIQSSLSNTFAKYASS